jgi:hypothetical protein
MALSKENLKARRELRKLVYRAEVLDHIAEFPIKMVFLDSKQMDDNWADVVLKGKGSKRYFQVAFDEKYMKTPHGRDLCYINAIHELAHVFTWNTCPKVETAKSIKYGEHGPDFGVVYAQLWTDLMGTYYGYEYEDDEKDES